MITDPALALILKGTVDVIEESELARRHNEALQKGRQLTVKLGLDPSAPDLHLGHTVVLRKMKHFQDAGHRCVFLIGDFTARIGDPTGKKKTRPQLTREEVAENAETYARQAFKILDRDKTVIEFNGKWLDELGADGLVRLAGKTTVARIIERDDFRKRLKAGQPIGLHELFYPLAQGYDSVALKADVELGGTDQLFNLLMGRDLQKEYGQTPQIVLTTPLLEGTDGVEKMSKSLGNAIGIDDDPTDSVGKLMSISDELMWKYQDFLTDTPPDDLSRWREESLDGRRNPRDIKLAMARSIVADFHGEEAATAAVDAFQRRFSKREIPADIPRAELTIAGPIRPSQILGQALGLSNAEARRLVQQGAVRRLEANDELKPVANDDPREIRETLQETYKVGKRRWISVVLQPEDG